MLDIIPAINATDWATVKARIEAIAPFADWVHLDAADGKFTKNLTWNNPKDLKTLETAKHLRLEVHIMAIEPEKALDDWIKAGVRRIILHWEALKPRWVFVGDGRKKIEDIARTLRENWVEFGIAILYRTPARNIASFLDLVDMVQVLGVEPGLAGQVLHGEAMERIAELRQIREEKNLNFKIEVDGGVNIGTIKDIYLAGADMVAAASAVFGSAEPARMLEALKRAIRD